MPITIQTQDLAQYPVTNLKSKAHLLNGIVKVESYNFSVTENIWGDDKINPGIMQVLHAAFQNHWNVSLSPDLIWQTICHGVAVHIKENAEKLRNKFVNFDGKKEIIIQANDFTKGDHNNNWQRLFPEFESAIKDYIGDKTDLLVANFSTTTPLLKACNQVMLMDGMSKYLDYTVMTKCGIPAITLTGEVGDWKDIADRVRKLEALDIGLEFWTKHLIPFVDQFVAAFENPDLSFWKSIYKFQSHSGTENVSGQVTALYPYLLVKSNTYIQSKFDAFIETKMVFAFGVSTNQIPATVSDVPFVWDYLGKEIFMTFRAGVLGTAIENETSKPVFGWIVSEMV